MAKGKEKGYSDSDPLIAELREYLRKQEIPIKECSAILYQYYLTSDKTEHNFYQRLYKLIQGDLTEISDTERAAYLRYMHAESNPHIYGSTIHSIDNLSKKIDQLAKYLDSSYVNRIEAKRLIKAIATLKPLETAHLQDRSE